MRVIRLVVISIVCLLFISILIGYQTEQFVVTITDDSVKISSDLLRGFSKGKSNLLPRKNDFNYTPVPCSVEQRERQFRLFKERGGTAGSARESGCPDESWFVALHDLMPDPSGKVFVNLGANKGYLLARTASLWAPWLTNVTVDNLFLRLFERKVDSPGGACSETAQAAPDVSIQSSRPQKDSQLPQFIGVEMIPETAKMLTENLESLGLTGEYLRVINAAVSNESGAVVFNKFIPVGEEWRLLSSSSRNARPTETGAVVQKISTQMFSEMYLKPDEKIFMLMIDTEGADPKVIDSGMQMIRQRRPTVIIFEYHKVWLIESSGSSLRSTLDSLEAESYECFFMGTYGFWRLTHCWIDDYEFYQFSNVVCLDIRVPEVHKLIQIQDLSPLFAHSMSSARQSFQNRKSLQDEYRALLNEEKQKNSPVKLLIERMNQQKKQAQIAQRLRSQSSSQTPKVVTVPIDVTVVATFNRSKPSENRNDPAEARPKLNTSQPIPGLSR